MHYDHVAAAHEAGQDIDLVLENNTPSTYSNMPTQQERDAMTQRAYDIGIEMAEAYHPPTRQYVGANNEELARAFQAMQAADQRPYTPGIQAELTPYQQEAALRMQNIQPYYEQFRQTTLVNMNDELNTLIQQAHVLQEQRGPNWNGQTPVRAFTGADFVPAHQWARRYPTPETALYPGLTQPTNTDPQTEQEMEHNTHTPDAEPIVVHTVARKDQTEDTERKVDKDEWLRFLAANNARKGRVETSEPMAETIVPQAVVQGIDWNVIDMAPDPAFATEARPMRTNNDAQPPW